MTIAVGATVMGSGEPAGTEAVEIVASRHPRADEMDAYERVLGDAMMGDATLFAREDYVEEAWRIVDPILKNSTPIHEYEKGAWGPSEVAQAVSPPEGWHNPSATEQEDFRSSPGTRRAEQGGDGAAGANGAAAAKELVGILTPTLQRWISCINELSAARAALSTSTRQAQPLSRAIYWEQADFTKVLFICSFKVVTWQVALEKLGLASSGAFCFVIEKACGVGRSLRKTDRPSAGSKRSLTTGRATEGRILPEGESANEPAKSFCHRALEGFIVFSILWRELCKLLIINGLSCHLSLYSRIL